MTRLGDAAAQTIVRRRLLANGYTPLANKDKMCILPGWSDLAVDEALIEKWSRELKWRATGVRVERGLAVIDLDVNDAVAVGAIIDALPEDIWALLEDAPVRRGKGAKEAWFCRLAEGQEPFYRLASAGFRQAAGDETVHRVEIFAGEGGGRQFGAYGAHTIGPDDHPSVVYHWAGSHGLLEVPFDDLPRLTRAQLATVADTATRVLDELGWERDLRSKTGFSSPAPIYDLADQEFETRDHGAVDLRGLQELCDLYGDIRLSASWLEGEVAVNMTRCIASIHPRDGRVSILETASFEIHRPADLAPKPVTQGALERLQAMASAGSVFDRPAPAPAPTAAQIGAEMRGDMEEVVEALLHDVAFCPSEQRCVIPIDGGSDRAMSLGNFRVLMQPWSVEVRGPRGGTQQINPASLWVADPRRLVVNGYRFRPDVPARLVEESGETFVNLYRDLPWPEVGEDDEVRAASAFEALLAHLVPDAAERDWFRMWLASKVQRPQAANCGVLMIADQQGTGRGTLFDMMRVAVGKPYYRSISSIELLGAGGQGAYTDWAAQSLLVTVEEVMAGADSGGNMGWKRREAYERIKQLVDPRQRVMEIRRKGLQNYSQEVFFSLLLATNHLDALPLDRNDRRIAVLIQPNIRFEDVPALKALVDPWRASGAFGDDFGAALRGYLMSVAVDFDALRIAPELSGGREVMRDNNEGDLEDILRGVLSKTPGDYILNRDLKRRMHNAITAEGEGDHLKNWWVKTQDILKRANGFGWRAMQVRQNYVIGGASGKGVVYYREAAGLSAWLEATWADRGSVLLAPASDVNRMMTAAGEALRDGRVSVVGAADT